MERLHGADLSRVFGLWVNVIGGAVLTVTLPALFITDDGLRPVDRAMGAVAIGAIMIGLEVVFVRKLWLRLETRRRLQAADGTDATDDGL